MPFQPFAADWDRPEYYSPEQWNWLAVEIAEIRRCVDVGDQAHDRLALLLTDHLVEVAVDREVNTLLTRQLPDHVIDELREARSRGAKLPALLAELVDTHLGADERRWQDRHLHEKTGYLLKHDVVTEEERQVLLRMHEYRNEAYHRDTLDGDVVRDLVVAYMVLANELLARHQPVMYTMSSSAGPVVTPGMLTGLLVDGLQPDLTAMAGRFSKHAQKRITELGRAVATARVLAHTAESGQDQDEPAQEDDFHSLLTTLNDVTPAKLKSFDKRAEKFKQNITSLVNLMLRYIGLDRDLALIEPFARRLQAILDQIERDAEDEAKEQRFLSADRVVTEETE